MTQKLSQEAKVFAEALKRFNDLNDMLGYSTYTLVDPQEGIVTNDNDNEQEELSIEGMVSEMEYRLSNYYDDDHECGEMRYDDLKQWRSETMKIRNFIRKYK